MAWLKVTLLAYLGEGNCHARAQTHKLRCLSGSISLNFHTIFPLCRLRLPMFSLPSPLYSVPPSRFDAESFSRSSQQKSQVYKFNWFPSPPPLLPLSLSRLQSPFTYFPFDREAHENSPKAQSSPPPLVRCFVYGTKHHYLFLARCRNLRHEHGIKMF